MIRSSTGGGRAVQSNRIGRRGRAADVVHARLMLLIPVVLLLLIGVVMIYSASSVEALRELGSSTYYLERQSRLLLLGVALCVIAAKIPYTAWLSVFCWVVWWVLVLALMVTTIIGAVGLGAQRWLTIPVLGTFQPSEFAKIAVILVLAQLLERFHDRELDLNRFMLLVAVAVLVPVVFIIFQPDLGTTIIVIMAAVFALWFGEIDLRPILIALGVVVVIGVFFIAISPYRRARFLTFLNPEADPLGDGYQTLNSLYAFGSGGFLGVGLGNSYQKYSYLPEAHTDFIFSIIGEELGFVGAFVVIALFIAFLIAGIKIAHGAPTVQGSVIAGSATATIVFQAFINIACTVGAFPVTGKPLPFVSYGGSSLWASLLLVGLILSVCNASGEAVHDARRSKLRVIDTTTTGADGGRGGNGGGRNGNRSTSRTHARVRVPARHLGRKTGSSNLVSVSQWRNL